MVYFLGVVLAGVEEPDEEGELEGEVLGDVVEDDSEGRGLEEVEKADCDACIALALLMEKGIGIKLTDNPVGQPLLVITGLGRLECPTAEVRGKQPSDGVGKRLGQTKQVAEDDNGCSATDTQDAVRLADTGSVLKLVEETVLGELSVKSV